jgi:hypothetical protein
LRYFAGNYRRQLTVFWISIQIIGTVGVFFGVRCFAQKSAQIDPRVCVRRDFSPAKAQRKTLRNAAALCAFAGEFFSA